MYAPIISTRTTNVELTDAMQALLERKLLAVFRQLEHQHDASFDVVLRRENHYAAKHQFYLSVKLTTLDMSFMTVAISPKFERAVSKAAAALKKQVRTAAQERKRHTRLESYLTHGLRWV